MSDSTSAFSVIARTVAAGQQQQIDVTGEYLACRTSSLPTFGLAIDGGTPQLFSQGQKVRLKSGAMFRSIIIDNSAGTGPLTVSIAYGVGDFFDLNFTDNTPLPAGLLTAPDVALAAGAQTPIVAAGVGVRRTIVRALSSNALPVRIGDINTGAARGAELLPGEEISFYTSAAVYGWNPHSAAQVVTVAQETN